MVSFRSLNGEEEKYNFYFSEHVLQGRRRRRRATGDGDVINAVLPEGYYDGWYCPPEGGNFVRNG